MRDSRLREAAQAGHDSFDRLCEEAVGEVFAALPALSADPAARGAVLAGTTALVRDLLDAVAEEEDDGGPPPELEALGRAGAPADLLRASRIARATVWRRLVPEILGGGEPAPGTAQTLELASARLSGHTDAVLDRLQDRWIAEREHAAVAAFIRRSAGVRAILAGEETDVAAASAALGYDLDRPLFAAVLWQDGAGDGVSLEGLGVLAATIARAVGADAGLTVPAGPGTLWAWSAAEALPDLDALTAAAEAAAGEGQGVALGTPGRGLEGFRRGHAEALDAHRVIQLAGRPACVLRYDAVEAVCLLTRDLERAGGFVRRTLGELAAPGEPAARMRHTLRVWLAAGGSAPAAAVPLSVHKNTVLYRVHRAEALLPRPIEADRLAVELALAVVETVGLKTLERPAVPARTVRRTTPRHG